MHDSMRMPLCGPCSVSAHSVGFGKIVDFRPLLSARTMRGLDSVFNPVRRFSRGRQEYQALRTDGIIYCLR
jgi:hypothetical protein